MPSLSPLLSPLSPLSPLTQAPVPLSRKSCSFVIFAAGRRVAAKGQSLTQTPSRCPGAGQGFLFSGEGTVHAWLLCSPCRDPTFCFVQGGASGSPGGAQGITKRRRPGPPQVGPVLRPSGCATSTRPPGATLDRTAWGSAAGSRSPTGQHLCTPLQRMGWGTEGVPQHGGGAGLGHGPSFRVSLQGERPDWTLTRHWGVTGRWGGVGVG